MEKLAVVLCVSIILVFDNVNSDFSLPRKKSDYFLNQNALPGIGIFAPEDIIPQSPDKIAPDHDGGDYLERKLVLAGGYPQSGVEISGLNAGAIENEEGSLGGRSSQQMIIDPIKDILLDDTHNETIEFNETSYSQRLIDCQKSLVLCGLSQVFSVSCYLHCLLAPHSVGHQTITSTEEILKTLCNPLGTVLDYGVPMFMKNFKSIQTLDNFLTLLTVAPDTMKRYARASINAVPALLAKYTELTEAVQLKTTMNGLDTAVRVASNGMIKVDTLYNTACQSIDAIDSVQQIVDAFYRDPQLFDLVLSGYWTTSKIYHLLSAPVRVPLQAFMAGMDILTGQGCGIISYAEKGDNHTCEEKVEWTTEHIVPPENGLPSICGHVPFYPRNIYDDEFPSIYQKINEPSTKENETSSGDGKNSQVKVDMTWVDEVLKTFDKDD